MKEIFFWVIFIVRLIFWDLKKKYIKTIRNCFPTTTTPPPPFRQNFPDQASPSRHFQGKEGCV